MSTETPQGSQLGRVSLNQSQPQHSFANFFNGTIHSSKFRIIESFVLEDCQLLYSAETQNSRKCLIHQIVACEQNLHSVLSNIQKQHEFIEAVFVNLSSTKQQRPEINTQQIIESFDLNSQQNKRVIFQIVLGPEWSYPQAQQSAGTGDSLINQLTQAIKQSQEISPQTVSSINFLPLFSSQRNLKRRYYFGSSHQGNKTKPQNPQKIALIQTVKSVLLPKAANIERFLRTRNSTCSELLSEIKQKVEKTCYQELQKLLQHLDAYSEQYTHKMFVCYLEIIKEKLKSQTQEPTTGIDKQDLYKGSFLRNNYVIDETQSCQRYCPPEKDKSYPFRRKKSSKSFTTSKIQDPDLAKHQSQAHKQSKVFQKVWNSSQGFNKENELRSSSSSNAKSRSLIVMSPNKNNRKYSKLPIQMFQKNKGFNSTSTLQNFFKESNSTSKSGFGHKSSLYLGKSQSNSVSHFFDLKTAAPTNHSNHESHQKSGQKNESDSQISCYLETMGLKSKKKRTVDLDSMKEFIYSPSSVSKSSSQKDEFKFQSMFKQRQKDFCLNSEREYITSEDEIQKENAFVEQIQQQSTATRNIFESALSSINSSEKQLKIDNCQSVVLKSEHAKPIAMKSLQKSKFGDFKKQKNQSGDKKSQLLSSLAIFSRKTEEEFQRKVAADNSYKEINDESYGEETQQKISVLSNIRELAIERQNGLDITIAPSSKPMKKLRLDRNTVTCMHFSVQKMQKKSAIAFPANKKQTNRQSSQSESERQCKFNQLNNDSLPKNQQSNAVNSQVEKPLITSVMKQANKQIKKPEIDRIEEPADLQNLNLSSTIAPKQKDMTTPSTSSTVSFAELINKTYFKTLLKKFLDLKGTLIDLMGTKLGYEIPFYAFYINYFFLNVNKSTKSEKAQQAIRQLLELQKGVHDSTKLSSDKKMEPQYEQYVAKLLRFDVESLLQDYWKGQSSQKFYEKVYKVSHSTSEILKVTVLKLLTKIGASSIFQQVHLKGLILDTVMQSLITCINNGLLLAKQSDLKDIAQAADKQKNPDFFKLKKLLQIESEYRKGEENQEIRSKIGKNLKREVKKLNDLV